MVQRENIIETATRMFVEQGIKAVRMDDIARAAGISKRTLYELFRDKEELLYFCMSHYIAFRTRRDEEIAAGSRNVLDAMLRCFGEALATAEPVYRLKSALQKFYPKVYERLAGEQRERDGMGVLRQTLQKGIEEGLFREDVDMELTVTMFQYSISGLVARRDVRLPAHVSLTDAFYYVVISFFRSMATPRGLQFIDEFERTRKGGE